MLVDASTTSRHRFEVILDTEIFAPISRVLIHKNVALPLGTCRFLPTRHLLKEPMRDFLFRTTVAIQEGVKVDIC